MVLNNFEYLLEKYNIKYLEILIIFCSTKNYFINFKPVSGEIISVFDSLYLLILFLLLTITDKLVKFYSYF